MARGDDSIHAADPNPHPIRAASSALGHGAEPSRAGGAIEDAAPTGGPFRVALSAGVGAAFGGILVLTVDKISDAYDATVPWYWLKLSHKGWNELISAILVTIIVVLFLEPLIEIIRLHDRRAGHLHPLMADRPRFIKWLFKIGLAFGLLLLNMSHDAVREYVDWENLGRNGALALQLAAAVIIIFGTTWVWARSTPFRLAAVLGCVASLSLGTATFFTYKAYEAKLSETNPNPSGMTFAKMTPLDNELGHVKKTAPKQGIGEDKKPAPDPHKSIAEPDKSAVDTTNVADPSKLTLAANHGIIEAPAAKTKPAEPPTPPGGAGATISLQFIFYAIAAWIPVGLFGGLILDLRRSSRPSIALAIGLGAITVICDFGVQIWLAYRYGQSISWFKTAYWFGLGAGWAAGIFILGPSADEVLTRRGTDIPALLRAKLSGWWRAQASGKL